MRKTIFSLLVLTCLLTVLVPMHGFAGPCSSFLGRASINEVDKGREGYPFVEVKILDASIPQTVYSNWNLRVCNSSAGCVSYDLSAGTFYDSYVIIPMPSPTYVELKNTGRGAGTDILLTDNSGKPIDYLSIAWYTRQKPSSCSSFPYDTTFSGSNSFGAARLPNGTGDWASLGPGNSLPPTTGDTNDDETGPDGNPVARVNISNVTVVKGDSATFTLGLFYDDGVNPPYSSTFPYDVVIQYDTLDDTAFSNVTVAPPNHDYVQTSGTITISAGTASAEVTVPTNALSPSPDGVEFWLRIVNPAGTAVPAHILNYFAMATITAPSASLDHFAIIHDGSGINCRPEQVRIEAHDASCAVFDGYTGTVNLSTSTLHGDWSRISGSGALTQGLSDSGAATYSFAAADNGVAVLGLKDTWPETVNLHVSDGAVSETSGAAAPSEDPLLTFDRAGFNFLVGGSAVDIGVQIAGKPSHISPGSAFLEIQAVNTNTSTGACEAALVGAQSIEFAFECADPTGCTSNALEIGIDNGASYDYTAVAGNSSGSVSSYTTVPNVDFGDPLDSTAPFVFRYGDVGRIRLYARANVPLDDGSGTPSATWLTGASNAFVVRPFALDVSVPGNPAAGGSAGGVFMPAGTAFSTEVRAVLWKASDDTNSDGIADGHNDGNAANNANLSDNGTALNFGQESTPEGVSLGGALVLPAGGIDPGLSGASSVTSFDAVTGKGSTSLRFDEVGIIELSAVLTDGNYLGVEAVSPGQSAKILGRSGYVGRFIPDHFETSVIAGCGAFNYSGQPFDHPDTGGVTGVEVTAYAANTPSTVTQNYDGGLAFSKDVTLSHAGDATNFSNHLLAAVNFSSGRATDTDITYTFPVKDTAPTTLTMQADDADGVSSGGHVEGTVEIRSGRFSLLNAFGPELFDLELVLTVEYYDGAEQGFLVNSADTCTALTPLTDVLLYNNQEPKAGQAVGDTTIQVDAGHSTTLTASPFVSGIATLTLSAPGDGGDGYVDLEINTPAWFLTDLDGVDQGLAGPLQHCTPGLPASNPAQIPGCVSDGTTLDDIPTARATFGVYKGHPRLIYMREQVQ